MRGQSTSSLRRLRVTAILLIASFAALVTAAAAYSLNQQYQATMDATLRAARNMVRTIDSHASQTFGETYRIIEGIADVYRRGLEAGTVSEGYLHELMRNKLVATPAVVTFFISDKDFNGIAGSYTFPVDISRVSMTGMSFENLKDVGGDRVIGQIYKNLTPIGGTPDWYLPLGVRVKDHDGQVAGYVFALLRASYFAEYYSGLDVGARGSVYLWTGEHQLVAATPNVTMAVGDYRNEEASSSRANDDVKVIANGNDRVNEVVALGQIGTLPLTASTNLNAEDFLAGWRSARNTVALAVLVMVTAMAGFGLIVLAQIRRSEENERALRLAKGAAEEANEAKSRFLAHMSHEFRTPLNAIMGFAEIIKNRVLGDGIVPAYTAYADHIHRSGEHLLNIVNDILDMAKIESGVQPLTREAIEIIGVLGAAVSFVEGLANQKGISIRIAASPHLPMVSGDQRFSRQVVINLLSNAIKFSPVGGEIVVAARYADGQFLDVSVSDNGPGIEPALLKRLGEPFLQGNPSVTHSGQGTGLGLSICKRYMDLLGGELIVSSVVGAGTTATIRFPQELLIVLQAATQQGAAAE